MLVSHIPLLSLAFSPAEQATPRGVIEPAAPWIHGDLAGHTHIGYAGPGLASGCPVYITDALWDDAVTLRRVEVRRRLGGFDFAHERWTLDEEAP